MRSSLLVLALAACGGGSSATDLAVADLAVDRSVLDASLQPDLTSAPGDLGAGASCTFNHDCIAADRCACSEQTGCFCELGPRGTGKNGVDACTSSNDCQSSLCVEGPGGVSYCSDECATDAQCGGMLPSCIDVSFIGQICARDHA